MSEVEQGLGAPANRYGEMARLVAGFDWRRTSLGPPEGWPEALKVAVGICLGSRFPMFVWWGPELVNIYNDAYVPMLGKRHPAALGRPARETWGDIWDVVGPQAEAVMDRGEATWNDRVKLVMERNGYWEDTWFTWSYSPIPDGRGGVGGLYCAVIEETPRVLAERARDLAEGQRRQGEFRFQRLVEQSPMSIQILAPDGTIRQVNRAWERLWGLRPADLPGYSIRTDPELARLGVAPLMERAFNGEAVRIDPIPYRPPAGEFAGQERWVGAYVFPVRDEAGRVEEVVLVHHDVTERHAAEERVRASERQMRVLTDALPALIGYVDDTQHYRFCNRAYQEWFGLDPVGRHLREVLGQADYRQRLPYVEEALRGRTVRFEGTSRHRARGSVPCELLYVPDVGEDGAVRGFVVLVQDVTERKRVESDREHLMARLREQHDRTAEILESISDAFYAVDGEWRFTYVNRKAEEMWGRRRESLVGRNIWQEFPRAVGGESHRRHIEVMGSRRAAQFETVSNVLSRWIDVSLYPEATGGLSCYFRDVSQRKRAEAEREEALANERAARAEAERASEAKSEFLATLSHELRTPLTPVLLSVSMMEAHAGLPADLREDVAAIRRNVELESRLISDLLDLTRIAKGKLQLDVTDVDVHAVVRAAVDVCQREASARLTVDLDAARHVVRGDPTRLQQIFWNLINNAIKFTPAEGSIAVRSVDAAADRIRVDVTDSGVGIEPDVLPRLFTAFEQGDVRAAKQFAGLGLGLAISRRLAEAHGGTIVATSPGRGAGATFTVELPTVAAPLPSRLVPPAPTNSHGAATRPLAILLVEDHQPTLRVMTKLLSGLGHHVTGVTSAAAATAALAHTPFDLLISDLGLPDGSGLDVMRRARPRYEGRAVALTGYGMESDIAACRDAGFTLHLTKPVDFEELKRAIDRVAVRT